MAYIWILLIVIILLLGLLIYLNIKDNSQSSDSKEYLRDLDKAVERQEATLFDLTKDIQSFQDPLNKLNRYLSGGTLAGKFGEWSLEAIIQDIFHPRVLCRQYLMVYLFQAEMQSLKMSWKYLHLQI